MRINIDNGNITFGSWKPDWLDSIAEGYEEYWGSADYRQFKSDRGPIDAEREDFVWQTHKGKRIFPREMATPHLFNTIKMLWNNIVPPVFRVGEFKRYKDIQTWSDEYLTRAMDELQNEFEMREDAGSEEKDLFNDMLLNSDVLKQL